MCWEDTDQERRSGNFEGCLCRDFGVSIVDECQSTFDFSTLCTPVGFNSLVNSVSP